MVILGINAYHGDASAAILVDGRLVAAAEEERFNRIKHAAGFPVRAVHYCLETAAIRPCEIDHVAVARDPRARILRKFVYAGRMPRLVLERIRVHSKFAGIETALSHALGGQTIVARVHRIEHHKAHLASAFFVSPFEKAALLSVDGLGDFASTMWGVGKDGRMDIGGVIPFPDSLGIFYTALSQYLGFWKYGDEYKVMGMSAYGKPEFREIFAELVKLNGRFGFSLGRDYFVHHRKGPEMTWEDGEPVLGKLYSDFLVKRLGSPRLPCEPIDLRHRNIAASLQLRLEEALLGMLNRLYERYRVKNLCLAGGVAFNCVANGKIFAQTPFEAVYIQPAAGDAGLAIGAAFYVAHEILQQPRRFEMKHAYWGPEFSDAAIGKELAARSRELERAACCIKKTASDEELCRLAAAQIAQGKIVGWFQGRMEWGPRALGNRSILADARRAAMKGRLNDRVKHRESFRPFSPSVLAERAGDYFEEQRLSPFMHIAYKVKSEQRSVIPATTHVDNTARVQTVCREENSLYWRLIKEFENLTGVPALLNTSFNDNEPIVCTPAQALDCFFRTDMDVLVAGKYIVARKQVRDAERSTADSRWPLADEASTGY